MQQLEPSHSLAFRFSYNGYLSRGLLSFVALVIGFDRDVQFSIPAFFLFFTSTNQHSNIMHAQTDVCLPSFPMADILVNSNKHLQPHSR